MTEVKRDLIDDIPGAFNTLSEDDRLFYSPSISGELYTGPDETRDARLAVAALTHLVFGAVLSREAAKQALSWRQYNVGATAIMVNFEKGAMGYLNGFNMKPTSGTSELNIHAEQMAISKGRRVGLDRVVALSVIANPNDLDANPDKKATLPPCGRCVEMFTQTPEVDEKTLVLGANPAWDVCELYTVGQLTTPDKEPLLEGPFSLRSEAELEYYDRNIKIALHPKIMSLYAD